MLDTTHLLDPQAEAAEAYVQAAFGLRLGLKPVLPTSLPHFLLDRYRLWEGSLLGQPMLLVAGKEVRTGTGFTANFIKHREILRHGTGAAIVILLLDHAPAAIRRQMVERRVGFLSPGNQLYIPEALIDLRERANRPVPEAGELVSPTAQLLLLAALQGEVTEDENLTALAERLNVAVMSVSRAMDELEALQLATARHVGRERRLCLTVNGGELWERVKPRLQSPVRKVRGIQTRLADAIAPRAGESALAHYTMLAAPRLERRAIAATYWKQLAPELDDGVVYEPQSELETWSYDPAALAHGGVVDPLSLYLSVRDDPDERVTQAAEQLLEPFGW